MAAAGFQKIFERPDRPLWLVTTAAGGERAGLVATFVHNVSLIPDLPRLIICIAQHHHTWRVLERSQAFSIHLLGTSNADLAFRFGIASGHDVDKFAGIAVSTGATGCPQLPGTLAWADCQVEQRMSIGDRTVYVSEMISASAGEVDDVDVLTAGKLLEMANSQQAAELARLQARDIERDRSAIDSWRRGRIT